MPCFDFFWNACNTYRPSARRKCRRLETCRPGGPHHLQDARTQPLQRLGRDVLPAALRQEQGVADLVLNTGRKRSQDTQRIADPHDGFELPWRHSALCHIRHTWRRRSGVTLAILKAHGIAPKCDVQRQPGRSFKIFSRSTERAARRGCRRRREKNGKLYGRKNLGGWYRYGDSNPGYMAENHVS